MKGSDEVFHILRTHGVRAKLEDVEKDEAIQEALEKGDYRAYRLILELEKSNLCDEVMPSTRRVKEKIDIPLMVKKNMTLTLDTSTNTKATESLPKVQLRNLVHSPLLTPTDEVS
eukprot:TRINITY_DN12877_c0_g2_i1.p4 TRINITY_DN12877_c0_g2~~TRINITY_DN12877_c0_g2_i1.p4  ORF type:complete len:115 (+),score=35.70 TRINITY_DN12877_c0_g2_i1:508-852(+)